MTGRRGKTTAERFWEKVDIRGTDECWPWTFSKGSHGYGAFRLNGETRTSHTMAYELATGAPIPEEYDEKGKRIEVCHSCHNRPCCNPAHLSLGTRAQNARQMADAERGKTWTKTMCDEALYLVRSRGWSVLAASVATGVSRSALTNHLNLPA